MAVYFKKKKKRKQPAEVFYKKAVLKNFAIFTKEFLVVNRAVKLTSKNQHLL